MKTSPETILMLIRKNKGNPQVRAIAIKALKNNGISTMDYPNMITSVADWVHANVKFKYDPPGTDVMFEPLEALRLGAVDCEDQTTLTSSLIESLGLPTKVVIVSKTGKVWDHVFLRAGWPPNNPKNWISVDTTISPPWGREIPFIKERVLPTGNFNLSSPDIDLIELLEYLVAPSIKEEVEKQFAPYPVTWVQNYAQKLTEKTERPGISYNAYVIPQSTINAFAVPGGNVYVTQGLIDKFGKDVVSGAIGHEIAHVAKRHAITMLIAQYGIDFIAGLINQQDTSRVAKEILNVIRLGYSRDMEFEADRESVLYNNDAGLYPFGMKRFLEWLVSVEEVPTDSVARTISEYLSTHPYASDRLIRVNQEIASLGIKEPLISPGDARWIIPVGIAILTIGSMATVGVYLSKK